jgi:hypothetical protein
MLAVGWYVLLRSFRILLFQCNRKVHYLLILLGVWNLSCDGFLKSACSALEACMVGTIVPKWSIRQVKNQTPHESWQVRSHTMPSAYTSPALVYVPVPSISSGAYWIQYQHKRQDQYLGNVLVQPSVVKDYF